MRYLSLIALLVFAIEPAAADDSAAFIRAHCLKCHGVNRPKADLRLDTLKWTPKDSGNVEVWQDIVDRMDAAKAFG